MEIIDYTHRLKEMPKDASYRDYEKLCEEMKNLAEKNNVVMTVCQREICFD